MKAFRARAAARYLAQRIADARRSAIRRSASHGLRFEPASPDYRVSLVADGNGNGLRTGEIQRGIDRPLTEPELLGWHFPDVTFGIQDDAVRLSRADDRFVRERGDMDSAEHHEAPPSAVRVGDCVRTRRGLRVDAVLQADVRPLEARRAEDIGVGGGVDVDAG